MNIVKHTHSSKSSFAERRTKQSTSWVRLNPFVGDVLAEIDAAGFREQYDALPDDFKQFLVEKLEPKHKGALLIVLSQVQFWLCSKYERAGFDDYVCVSGRSEISSHCMAFEPLPPTHALALPVP